MGTGATRRLTQASKSPGLRNAMGAGVLAVILTLAPPAPARERAALPHAGEHTHLGVATCASSTCHGSAEPLEAAPVLQNEYLTWHRRDAHAQAYETLLEDRSERIAQRLDLGPPETADRCLDCHADNVAADRRGERFQIEDGVGCEACHGGAEEWIKTHATDEASHADNIARGMYPTDRPAARARLCLSCHYSHPDQPMTHELMAAGHPPLQFELATFSRIQPPHYRVDADYRERKRAPTAVRTWAVGEIVTARKTLARIRDDLDQGGTFPELYYFDCKACHHDLADTDWVGSAGANLPVGRVPLEDASMRMVGTVLGVVAPGLADTWRARLDALQASVHDGSASVRRAATRLRKLTRPARRKLAGASFDGQRLVALMRAVVEAGQRRGYGDRTWADQATMALGSLLTTAAERDVVADSRLKRLDRALDELYACLDDPKDYAPQRFRKALATFAERLP